MIKAFSFFLLLICCCISINSQQVSNTIYFDRASAIERLKHKINAGQTLVIHAHVPLCDNDYQGIIPVNEKLGNGLDLRNNLYWGAKYGIKNYFKRYTDWKLLKTEKDVNDNILERVIFYKTFPNKAKVYLVADAYRGDKMLACLKDFMNSIAGRQTASFTKIEQQTIGLGSNADFLIMNGHNGLMDYQLPFVQSKEQQIRDVAVIGCRSHSYFKEHLTKAKGYPLLMTTNLMAPEAYVMEAVVESWAVLDKETTLRAKTGRAYHKFQKCGVKGATNLFKTGW